MEFFDAKEDVLEIVLTSYGAHLLSVGLLDAKYYAFFDDDILYDSRWASQTTEGQSKIEPRIQEKTPYVRAPVSALGVETTINEIHQTIRTTIGNLYGTAVDMAGMVVQDTYTDAIYSQEIAHKKADDFPFLTMPLGTSELSSYKYPAWNINVLRGAFENSKDYLIKRRAGAQPSLDGQLYEQIPQINITLNYQVYVDKLTGYGSPAMLSTAESMNFSSEGFPAPAPELHNVPNEILTDQVTNIASELFTDGTFFHLVDGKIILDVQEMNTMYKKENFSVQIFHSKSASGTEGPAPGTLDLLLFATASAPYTSLHVEKFLSINLDREIQDNTLKDNNLITFNELQTDANVANVISTKEFLIRDIYEMDPEVCD